jgi:tRNA threonylcarbamoyladenosine biosynthesis protein TsaB
MKSKSKKTGMSDPVFLLIETATEVCSVGISRGKKITVKRETFQGNSHAENIGRFVVELQQELKIEPEAYDAVVISGGPGSYTGLRIGTSFAKGMCFGKDLPLIAINTLEGLSRNPQVRNLKGLRIPMLDARRMEVYASCYDENDSCILEPAPLVLDNESFGDFDGKELHFFGNGMPKFREISKVRNAKFYDEVNPNVDGLAELAYTKFIAGEFADVAYFEPEYLKAFIAGPPKKML